MSLLRTLFIGAVLAGVGAFGIGYLYREGDAELQGPINIITESEGMEGHFEWTPPGQTQTLRELIGDDMPGYRGHLLRVLTYTMHYLGKEAATAPLPLIEMALVYHDIGLWSDAKMAYLEPSCVRAAQAAEQMSLSSEDTQLLHDIIYWHHKVTPFEGKHAAIVNAVRLADHIDASMGLMPKGMPWAHITKVMEAIPNAGFHQTLMAFMPKFHGWNIPQAMWEVSHVYKW